MTWKILKIIPKKFSFNKYSQTHLWFLNNNFEIENIRLKKWNSLVLDFSKFVSQWNSPDNISAVKIPGLWLNRGKKWTNALLSWGNN